MTGPRCARTDHTTLRRPSYYNIDAYCKYFSEQRWMIHRDGSQTQQVTSGCHPPSFRRRTNAFPSTTTTAAKSGRLVWFIVSICSLTSCEDIRIVSVKIYDYQSGYIKEWNKTDFCLANLFDNHLILWSCRHCALSSEIN